MPKSFDLGAHYAGYLGPVMSYMSLTYAGVTRGPHEHTQQTDIFVFIGDFQVVLWDNRPTSKTYKERNDIYTWNDFSSATPMSCITPFVYLVVPPGVVHAYKNIHERNEGYVLNFPTTLYKGLGKRSAIDEIRHELDPNSEFKI